MRNEYRRIFACIRHRGSASHQFFPSFWPALADDYHLSLEKRQIKQQLWTGAISVDELWRTLGEMFPAIPIDEAKQRLTPGAPVLFVDDQEKNLASARSLGWNTMLADDQGDWRREAEAWLTKPSEKHP
ncbi:hypothetical protein [Cohnella sp. REN36]|uniref:hypothetical protein n=1 Tax=Cohnella sp. REN36 TaxID=2887347 RepID=UPI001D13F2DC|nr:hypothetical protein [Cohnella sp. REN36]MCC3377260.1 hypothetical protein [Cohnella sp. REN36]